MQVFLFGSIAYIFPYYLDLSLLVYSYSYILIHKVHRHLNLLLNHHKLGWRNPS